LDQKGERVKTETRAGAVQDTTPDGNV
jgi:hypothetical protein